MKEKPRIAPAYLYEIAGIQRASRNPFIHRRDNGNTKPITMCDALLNINKIVDPDGRPLEIEEKFTDEDIFFASLLRVEMYISLARAHDECYTCIWAFQVMQHFKALVRVARNGVYHDYIMRVVDVVMFIAEMARINEWKNCKYACLKFIDSDEDISQLALFRGES